ncbi:hypothetical protein EAG_04017 [Camponotus floridanus]|uniref:Uncharacterized protein n=1 Tax=Camponotus floridanus TaxID=104421 RepID=E2B0Y9_CAMFO|nr:hypothetical protein EAG_04017 [Camponotus floridanus]
MASIVIKRRRREQSELPSEARATELRAPEAAATETAVTETAATKSSALHTVLLEMRRMREEQARREEEIAAVLRRHDEEIQLLRGSQLQPTTQLRACPVDWGLTGTILGNREQQFRESRISFGVLGSPQWSLSPLLIVGTTILKRVRVVTALPLSGSRRQEDCLQTTTVS